MAESTTPENNNEIDLSKVSREIKARMSRANDSVFDWILFIKRNIIIVIILLILGVAAGFYLDRSAKVYEHKMYTIPNFGSVDYLYSEIDHINSKIKEKDTVFLKSIGITNTKKFVKLEIEPVVDIYEFIDDSDEKRLELFKILAENGDLPKILEENTTSKNYKNHLITFTTRSTAEKSALIDPVLKYLNSSSYFDTIKKQSIKNLEQRITSTDSVMTQIDGILNSSVSTAGSGNSVYYKDNTNLNEIINIKTYLIRSQEKNKIALINSQKVIKDSAIMMNIKKISTTTGMMKVIVPIVFLCLFFAFMAFRSYYKKQVYKRSVIGS